MFGLLFLLLLFCLPLLLLKELFFPALPLFFLPSFVLLPLLSLSPVEVNHILEGSLGNEEFCQADLQGTLAARLRKHVIVIILAVASVDVHELRHLALLLPLFLGLLLESLVLARERRVDHCQGQVQQEERADEDRRNEEDDDEQTTCHLVVEHRVAPAFESDVLERVHEGPEDVVIVCHAAVGVGVHFATVVQAISRAFVRAAEHSAIAQPIVFIEQHSAGCDVDATLFEVA